MVKSIVVINSQIMVGEVKGCAQTGGFYRGEQYEDSIGDLERTPCYTKPYGKEIQKQGVLSCNCQ